MNLRTLRIINRQRSHRWHSGDAAAAWTIADWATALGGECGEALNVVKKMRRAETGARGDFDPEYGELAEMLAAECADVLLYLDLLADACGIDLAEAVIAKFNETSERYGYPERLEDDPLPECGDVIAVALGGERRQYQLTDVYAGQIRGEAVR